MVTLEARITKEASFTEKELLLLINASLAEWGDPVINKASDLLYEKFGGNGYISGNWIQDAAYEYDREKYNIGGFNDIDF